MDIKRPPRLLTYIYNTTVIKISPAGFKFISWLLTTDHCHNIFNQKALIEILVSLMVSFFPCNNCLHWQLTTLLFLQHHYIYKLHYLKQKQFHVNTTSQHIDQYKYRTMSALKVETDIITSIAVSLIGRAVIPGTMYVRTLKTYVTVFIGIKLLNVMPHWPIFSSIRISALILTISLNEIKIKNV